MNTDNHLRTQSLDLLRFPLAIVVLTIHAFGTDGIQINLSPTSAEQYPIFTSITYFIEAFLAGKSVPIYYFISGFVFFLGVEMTYETYARKFKNRIKSLVIPYFVWNALALLMVLLITVNPLLQEYTSGKSFSFSWYSLVSCFWGGFNVDITPVNGPLWFVRDLIIVVICTPLLHCILKRTKYYFVCLLGIAWFVLSYFQINVMGFDSAFFFFSWGAYLSIHRKDMLEAFGKYNKIAACLYLSLCSLHIMLHDYSDCTRMIKLFTT